MRCVLCNSQFDFGNDRGVNYRGKPICDECIMNMMFICLDKNKERIKRYLKQEMQLQFFS
ncbi:MAG: hypothetical protein QW416_01965 [Candidatus Nitrosocaldaceae archaeon]